MRSVTIAAVQPPNRRDGATLEEQEASNVAIAFGLMEEAVARGARLICLPEHFATTGLAKDPATAMDLAESEDGPLAARLSAFAGTHRVNLVAPVHARDGISRRNAAWVFGADGELVGRYFKVHCTRGERERGIVPGDEWPVFSLDIGRIGVMICHDNSWPEAARCLALNGAEIVCWPHVQSGWGDVAWDITLRSRAIDSGVFLLSSCYGVADEVAWRPGMMVGRSSIVGPDGTVVADTGRLPGVATALVDLDRPLWKHDFSERGDLDFRADLVVDRRPDTYAPLVRVPHPDPLPVRAAELVVATA